VSYYVICLRSRISTASLLACSVSSTLTRVGRDAVFAGLSLDEYLALSEEAEQALWDGLFKEAGQELKLREQDIPADFVPARQKRR
jgi:hypothetical protein